MGGLPSTAQCGQLSVPGTDHGGAAAGFTTADRHRSSHPHAGGQAKAVHPLPPRGTACITIVGKAVEMTGRGKRGKPNPGFPLFPPPLEIANSAISTFPPPRRLFLLFPIPNSEP